MNMKKALALIPAGVLAAGMCLAVSASTLAGGCLVVSAAPNDSASVSGNTISVDEGIESASGEESEAPEYDRAAEAHALAIKATGIPQEAWAGAEAEDKSIGEYMSNSVMEVPGLDEVTPVGQGGSVIIDGKASNVTLSVQKPLLAHVNAAKTQATTVGGKVLNVVNIKTTVSFGTATVNFYMPGVTAETNIQVYQYVDQQWVSVDVTEVREDHVVVDMTRPGVVAFFEVQ